ncbi:MAG: hypothetical protein CSA64_04140 [Arachnia propionica]|nr:MAG: hypothetical protein CSA64_04140 [Arachnia propionica]
MKYLTGWLPIVVLGLVFLSFGVFVLPACQGEINQLAGAPVRSLDMRFAYSHDDVIALFQTLGDAGRAKLQFISGVVDMIYPLVYGSLLFLLLRKLASGKQARWLRLLAFLPVAAVAFDYVENVNNLIMLSRFPVIGNTQVLIGSAATSVKWSLLGLTLAALIILVALRISGLLRARRERSRD